MIRNKHINIIIACIMALAIIGVTVFMALPQNNTTSSDASAGKTMDYEKTFANDVIQINIEADEKDWQNMLDNATSEEYITCNVKINGTTVSTVGIRPKGNSSLTQVASSDSDRYSFKMEFDHYVKGQTYEGLDKLVLNNIQSDNTYMKEYLSYQIMSYAGVTSPLCTYANITVNGKEWGLYLAVEALEDSYTQRTNCGNLYKPESDDMGGGNRDKDANKNDNMQADPGGGAPPQMNDNQNAQKDTQDLNNATAKSADNATDKTNTNNDANVPQNNKQQGGMMGGGPGGQNSEDCALKYIDDTIDSYANIFDNAVSDVDKSDKKKVITAIKNLNEGTDLEKYIHVDEVLQYFAANTVLVNLDSYSGSMLHNYYLEESDGQLSILPWDFNLSFAGFSTNSASDAVNFPIDTPVSGDLADRPLIGKLLENSEYKAKYHAYLQKIVEGYFNSGLFENTITKVQKSISKYVKEDATAFCTYEEYTAGVDMLRTYGKLRAKSVEGQLNGTVPSTKATQSKQTDKLIDASSVNLKTMGSQGGGMEKNEKTNAGDAANPTVKQDTTNEPTAEQNTEDSAAQTEKNNESISRDTMQKVMNIIGESQTLSEDQKTQLKALGLTEDQITQFMERKTTFRQNKMGNSTQQNGKNAAENEWQKKEGGSSVDSQMYIVLGASVLVVLLAIALAFFFRKKI